MRPVTPPPPAWKAVFLPGLLLGVLLALLQVALLYGLSAFGLLQLPNSFAFLWYMLLLYLVMPALFAFLVKVRTGRPATGNRVGRCAGIICAILLFGATIVSLAYTQANPQPAPQRPRLDDRRHDGGGHVVSLHDLHFINALGGYPGHHRRLPGEQVVVQRERGLNRTVIMRFNGGAAPVGIRLQNLGAHP